MSSLADWLQRLLTHGEAVVTGSMSSGPAEDAAARSVLARAFFDHALDVAGPPVAFDPASALAAASYVADACWLLLRQNESVTGLPPLGEPGSPSAHLSGDLTLRFLPAVYRRAALRSAGDSLAAEFAEVLRRWPLSGVLADLPARPAGDLGFGGHPGLQLLYAERLVGHENPSWIPAGGPTWERVELVFRGRGRPLPPSIREESSGE